MSDATESVAPSTVPSRNTGRHDRPERSGRSTNQGTAADSTAADETAKAPATDVAPTQPTAAETTAPATTTAPETSAPASSAAPTKTDASVKRTSGKPSRTGGSTRGDDQADKALKILRGARKLEDFWTPFYGKLDEQSNGPGAKRLTGQGKSTLAEEELKPRVAELRQKLAATTSPTGVILGSCATSDAIQSANFTLQSILDTVVDVPPMTGKTGKPDEKTYMTAKATTQLIGKKWAKMAKMRAAKAETTSPAESTQVKGGGGGGGATTTPTDVVKKAQAAETTGKSDTAAASTTKGTVATAPPDTTSPPSSTAAAATTGAATDGDCDSAKFDTSVIQFVRQEVKAMLGFSTAKRSTAPLSSAGASKRPSRRPSSSAAPTAETAGTDNSGAGKTTKPSESSRKMTEDDEKAYRAAKKKRAEAEAAAAA